MMTMRYLLLQFLSFTMMNGFMVQANVRWVVDFYLGHTNSFIFHYKINNEFMTCFQQFFPWIFLILNSWKRKQTSYWSKKVFSQFASWKRNHNKYCKVGNSSETTDKFIKVKLKAYLMLQRICYSHWANGARNGVISIGQWGCV